MKLTCNLENGTLKFKNYQVSDLLFIFNRLGQSIRGDAENIENIVIESPGIYFIQIFSNEGSLKFRKKIIIN